MKIRKMKIKFNQLLILIQVCRSFFNNPMLDPSMSLYGNNPYFEPFGKTDNEKGDPILYNDMFDMFGMYNAQRSLILQLKMQQNMFNNMMMSRSMF